MKVAICGGGIGGMTAALGLNHFGIEVDVHERAEALEEVGAGIQISPNAMKVFQALRINRDVIDAGFLPEAIEIRMGESGQKLIRTELGVTAERRYGAPYVHIHRADLLRVLSDAVDQRTGIAVHLGCELKSYRHSGDRLTIEAQSGEAHSADVLVGADGIHSAIRAQMLGADAPRFTGNVAWRTVVPVEKLGPNAPDPTACAWVGRGKHAVTYLLRGGKLANLVAVVERSDWQNESWTARGSKQQALNDFAGWHPAITQMIEESEELFQWALFDRAPLKTWTDGSAALLGDAAHPMLPFMAQGAAMAIEDAWALAVCLAENSDAEMALTRYEKIRHGRASQLQAKSRANAKMFHQRSLLGRLKNYGPIWLAGRVAPGIGLQRQDWVYGYDIVETMRQLRAPA